MILLFSYGTLRDKEVQLEEFGVNFEIESDIEEISGYDMSEINIDGNFYNILVEGKNESTIKGSIVHIPDDMIHLVDDYEGKPYKRISVKTISGRDCMIYVKRT
jgi:gamma-glutamylcyclotransferase (GGCT)/AIG2-like uncharacterized protein YtfP